MASTLAVRILPMDPKEFDGLSRREVQKSYFQRDLPERNGRFLFYKKGLNAEQDDVVLFQYDNALIASARFVDSMHYKKPVNGYHGHLDFEPKSIRIFEPVTFEQTQKIWPKVQDFGQVKWDLDPEKYGAFQRLTLKGITIAESILRGVADTIGMDRKKIFSRDDVRRAEGIDRRWWMKSWNPIFQGMRIDHPGNAPVQAKNHRNVFRSVARGQYMVTDYGWSLVRPKQEDEDGKHGKRLREINRSLDEKGRFDANDQSDERERKLVEINLRRGSNRFRRKLLNAYDERCAVTGCDATAALEAAHILPYVGEKSDFVSNGLLLRSDIHTLFDLDLIGIHPSKFTISLASSLGGTSYEKLAGKKIAFPRDPEKQPNAKALGKRWREFRSGS